MAATITQSIIGNSASIVIKGRFDFTCHREFRQAYEELIKNPDINQIDLNFQAVDYLDSSALGMLLLLREKAAERNIQINLNHCQGTVQQVLEVANFNKLFSIS